MHQYAIWSGDVGEFLEGLPQRPMFDLVVTSPPYNIGKPYENRVDLDNYVDWHRRIVESIVPRLSKRGSLCWQVGNYVNGGGIEPLDYIFHPIFREAGLTLRNRIVWHFGHGVHCRRRFSHRYEVVLWYTQSDLYHFDLDAVRVASKYPGKKFYKGPNAGKISSNPNGKNPEDVWSMTDDVWNIPNVKARHREKTDHPCQFPVGLIERLVLALTKPGDLVFDPFSGVGSAGVAAAVHRRHFWGCEILPEYVATSAIRINEAIEGTANYRKHDVPIFDHRNSPLSRKPDQ